MCDFRLFFFLLYFSVSSVVIADAQNFKFQAQGDAKIVGRLDLGDSRSNAFMGKNAGSANTSGFYNTAAGYEALFSNTNGFYNTSTGYLSLYFNEGGSHNTALGNTALYHNVSGNYNTAIGSFCLPFNEASENTAIGYQAAYHTRTGSKNTVLGYEALYSSVGMQGNTAIGYRALYSNNASNYSTAVGAYALENSTSGTRSTAVGFEALQNNTTGTNNTAVGFNAMRENIDGEYNAALGSYALHFNRTGNGNVAHGDYALQSLVSGDYNIAIGKSAMAGYTSGNHNIAIGYQSSYAGNFSNTVSLGHGVGVSGDNQVRIGNAQTTSIGGYAAWSNFSDKRLKKQIRQDVPGLAFIRLLRPVTYRMDHKAIAAWQGVTSSAKNATTRQEIRRTGFLAQEVEAAARKIGYEFSGVDAPQNDNDRYALRYAEFVVPLVQAVQELEEENETLKEENELLARELAELKVLIYRLAEQLPTSSTPAASPQVPALLHQNEPNPSRASTLIRYFVPETVNHAVLRITDARGVLLQEIAINGPGEGSIEVNTTNWSAGQYYYSLVLDGQLFATKKIIRTGR